jgi:hypothetical protein
MAEKMGDQVRSGFIIPNPVTRLDKARAQSLGKLFGNARFFGCDEALQAFLFSDIM